MDIKNPILEAVFNYYEDGKNYLNESMNEEGQCAVVDDKMFGDLMDMVQKGVYEEIENNHILIPTMGAYTFHITPSGECYIDDERGNEFEAQIDRTKLQQLLQSINTPQYRMVSEGASNPFSNVQQDPETGFITFTKKDNVSPEDAMNAAHDAVERAKERRYSQKEDEFNNPSLQDRRNDPEYMDQVADYWNNRRDNMAEPHGFGTSGTKPLFPLEEMNIAQDDDNNVYDLANDEKGDKPSFAAKGAGYIKLDESKLSQIIDNVLKEIIK